VCTSSGRPVRAAAAEAAEAAEPASDIMMVRLFRSIDVFACVRKRPPSSWSPRSIPLSTCLQLPVNSAVRSCIAACTGASGAPRRMGLLGSSPLFSNCIATDAIVVGGRFGVVAAHLNSLCSNQI